MIFCIIFLPPINCLPNLLADFRIVSCFYSLNFLPLLNIPSEAEFFTLLNRLLPNIGLSINYLLSPTRWEFLLFNGVEKSLSLLIVAYFIAPYIALLTPNETALSTVLVILGLDV